MPSVIMTESARTDALLLALTAGAASTDALSYLGLGKVFPANMTGNTVLLAVGTATGDYGSAVRSLLALAGFVFGAALAGIVVDIAEEPGWSRPVTIALLAELTALIAAAGWWLDLPQHPGGSSRLGLIALLGVAMGAQSGAIARLGVGVSTTYITGTWTQVSGWLAGKLLPVRPQPEDTSARHRRPLQVAVLLGYFAAALGSGYLFRAAGAIVALVPCAAVATVSVFSVGSRRGD